MTHWWNRKQYILMAALILIFGLTLGLQAEALGQANWQEKWERVLAKAKKEGTVVVAASPSPKTRLELESAFAKQFGFRLEYLALGGRHSSARVEREAAAGRLTIDVLLSGNTELFKLYPAGRLGPVKDKLMLPEALDRVKWRNKTLRFNDPEKRYFLQTMEFVPADLIVNTSFVKPQSTLPGKIS